jgi:hypothetical protein
MLIQPSIDRWCYRINQQGKPNDQQHGVDHVPHFSLLVTRSEATNHIGRADSPQSVPQRLFEKITLMGLHREAVPSKLKGQHHDSDCGNPTRNGATAILCQSDFSRSKPIRRYRKSIVGLSEAPTMNPIGDKPPTACPVSEPMNHAPIAARGTRIALRTLKRVAPPRPVTIINVAMAGIVESSCLLHQRMTAATVVTAPIVPNTQTRVEGSLNVDQMLKDTRSIFHQAK